MNLAAEQAAFVVAATGGPAGPALGLTATQIAQYAGLLQRKRGGELAQALPRTAAWPGFATAADQWWHVHHHRDPDHRAAVLAFARWLRPRLPADRQGELALEVLAWRACRRGPWLGWAWAGRLHLAWRCTPAGPLHRW